MFNVILVEPQIPQNTGNIVRLCAATGMQLIIVGEPGFSLHDRYLKRAGLDYWEYAHITHKPDIDTYLADLDLAHSHLLTTKVKRPYTHIKPQPGDSFLLNKISGSPVTGLVGFINLTWIDFGLIVFLALGNGYVTIIFFTWIQTRTLKEMPGRIMSLLMLSSAGLVPISQAISGAVISWNLALPFVLVTIWAAFQPALVTFSESLSAQNSSGCVFLIIKKSSPNSEDFCHTFGCFIQLA